MHGKKDKILFLFGAGASHAEGAPLQRGILPYILDHSREIGRSSAGMKVRAFMKRNFAWNREEGVYPSLESVFAFLDYLIYKNESLGGEFTNEYIRGVRESLIKLIHYSVSKVSTPRTGVYRRFWERVFEFGPNLSIFTTNYDTFIDEAFALLNPNHAFLDYCMPLMNFDRSDTGHPFRWLIGPEESRPATPGRVKLVKLHGSLNWKYCNCCNQVLLTPWDTAIDLESWASDGHENPSCMNPASGYPCTCPHDGTPFQTLIVPPAHLKIPDHPAINALMNEAAREVRKARRIVCIGYSLPDADVHLKALFRKNLDGDARLTVVNRERSSRIEMSYRALTDRVTFLWHTFEEVVEDRDLMEGLFQP